MRERIVRPLAAGALCVCALIVGAKADCSAAPETTTAVNLRTGAGTGNAIIATVGEGTALIVEADTGSGWYKVNYDGESGYMSADYLSFSETMDLTAQGWVDGSDVRMRAAAGTDSEIVRVTTYGESVEILGVDGEWYKVSAGGKTGYIRGDYVSFTEPDPSQAPAAGSIGEQIVAFAEQFLGTPYVWAGSSPSGFDCSGFVSYVFKNFGYTVNRHRRLDVHQRRRGGQERAPDRRRGVLRQLLREHRPRGHLHRRRRVHPQQLRLRLRHHLRPGRELLLPHVRRREAHRLLT